MDMNLRKFQEIVKDREAWLLQLMGWQRVEHDLATEQQQQLSFIRGVTMGMNMNVLASVFSSVK